MLWGCEHTVLPLNSLPLNPYPSVSGSLLAVGLPNVLKFSGVETSANGLWSPNGLYLFMQALASPQDSVALTQEDSRALKKNDPLLGSLSILGQWVDKWSRQRDTTVDDANVLHSRSTFSSLYQSPLLFAL